MYEQASHAYSMFWCVCPFVYRRSVSNPLEINYSRKICRHGYIIIIMMIGKLYSHVDVFVLDSNQTKYNIL